MRQAIFCALSAASLFFHVATAYGDDFKVYRLGENACNQVLGSGGKTLADGNNYVQNVRQAGIEQSAFCRCVASEFVRNEPLQSFRMVMAKGEKESAEVFTAILTENLDTCLDPSEEAYADASRHILAEPDVIDGDLVGTDLYGSDCASGCQDGPDWKEESDLLHCTYAIDGTLEPTGFDRDTIDVWMKDSGLDADSLCQCAAAVMKDKAEEAGAGFDAARDPEPYWDNMNMSIDQCQTAMWTPDTP